MSKATETTEAKLELAKIALAAGIDSARRAVVEIEGFAEVNSYNWPASVGESAKMLAKIAMDIQRNAAVVDALRMARADIAAADFMGAWRSQCKMQNSAQPAGVEG